MGPWSADQIEQARNVPLLSILEHLGCYTKRDHEYAPLDPARRSIRLHVNFSGRDFRFVLTGEKWVNELAPAKQKRGGGGAIDFVSYLTGFKFVQAVKTCLDAQVGASQHD